MTLNPMEILLNQMDSFKNIRKVFFFSDMFYNLNQ